MRNVMRTWNKENNSTLFVIWLNLSLFSPKHQTLREILTKWKSFRAEGATYVKGTSSMTDEDSLKELWMLNLYERRLKGNLRAPLK